MAVFIDGPTGRLEALVDQPDRPVRAAAVLAPPHPELGGTMQDRVLHTSAAALTDLGCVTLRFNYRGIGLSGGPEVDAQGAHDDYRAALDWLESQHPDLPLWAAGYSFGSWVAMTAGAQDDRVAALVGIAPPIESYDYSVLRFSTKPKFFIHGEQDTVCPVAAVRRLYAKLPEPRDLLVFEGADHTFDGHVLEVGDAVTDLFEDWMQGGTHA